MTRTVSLRISLPILTAAAVLVIALAAPGGELSGQDASRASQVCLECHADQAGALAATPHRIPEAPADSAGARVACTDCHAGDSRHWEEDPARFPMANPASLGATAEAQVCSGCHQSAHQQNMLEKNVHTRHDVSCSGCHEVHGAARAALLKQEQTRLCLSCHTQVEGEFARPYRHPVHDGVVECSECHRSLDETRRSLSQDANEACTRCHGELEGPFVFEHQAALDYSTEEGGCLSCHEPHGGPLPRLLKQPFEPPHFQLCAQCHSVPGHNLNPMHGTQFAGVPCNDCHTDIHGSYDSRLLLSESLRGSGCFNAGCHRD